MVEIHVIEACNLVSRMLTSQITSNRNLLSKSTFGSIQRDISLSKNIPDKKAPAVERLATVTVLGWLKEPYWPAKNRTLQSKKPHSCLAIVQRGSLTI